MTFATPWPVRIGADVLVAERCDLVEGRACGLITNSAALMSDGRPSFEGLADAGVRLAALFSPEHGLLGSEEYGTTSIAVGGRAVPVYDLYGERRRLAPEQLDGLDLLLFDLQGLGVRFYTYESTLYHVMEAAAAAGILVIVLDRPEPLGGVVFEGPPMQPEWRSFVGIADLPARHGLTIGEVAQYFNRYCLQGAASLTVVACAGWRRGMMLDETGLPWAPPSPGIRSFATMLCYPMTCFLEGTNLSEGRGTDLPFEQFGAPWVQGALLSDRLNALGLPGVWFTEARFEPRSSKWMGEACGGCRIHVTNLRAYRPLAASVHILYALRELWPRGVRMAPDPFHRSAVRLRRVALEARRGSSIRGDHRVLGGGHCAPSSGGGRPACERNTPGQRNAPRRASDWSRHECPRRTC
jgi:uncharacterized protein YbbC (DUF1343 family)